MPLTVNTNTLSLNAQRNLTNNTNMLAKSMERLSSGYRINRAGDDAAGLQLSENLRGQVRGSQRALDNVLDGIGMLNIADGAYQTIQDNLQRIRELLVQSANDTYAPQQRAAIVVEVEQLLRDNDRIAQSTTFNGVALMNVNVPPAYDPATNLDGFWLQVAPNSDQPIPVLPATPLDNINRIDIASALVDLTSNSGTAGAWQANIDLMFDGTNLITPAGAPYTGNGDGIIDSNTEAQELISIVDNMMTELNVRRGNLGAIVNRLEGAANNLSISIENLSSAESRIRNVDVAAESGKLTQAQIMQQSAAIVLSQANQTPALALQLLQGN